MTSDEYLSVIPVNDLHHYYVLGVVTNNFSDAHNNIFTAMVLP